MPKDYSFKEAVDALMASRKYREKVCKDPAGELTKWGGWTEGERAAIIDIACRFFTSRLDKALDGSGETHKMWITDD
jgi:hypothetical protein